MDLKFDNFRDTTHSRAIKLRSLKIHAVLQQNHVKQVMLISLKSHVFELTEISSLWQTRGFGQWN